MPHDTDQWFSKYDPRQTASVSSGNWLNMQLLQLCSRLPECETLGMKPSSSHLTVPPGDSDTC